MGHWGEFIRKNVPAAFLLKQQVHQSKDKTYHPKLYLAYKFFFKNLCKSLVKICFDIIQVFDTYTDSNLVR